jgi:hypothetical protein
MVTGALPGDMEEINPGIKELKHTKGSKKAMHFFGKPKDFDANRWYTPDAVLKSGPMPGFKTQEELDNLAPDEKEGVGCLITFCVKKVTF